MPPSPTSSSCIMYLVRHGATDNNLADPPLLQGRAVDLGLSAAGIDQAARTARALSVLDLAAFYSSPLIRARQTAEALAEPHHVSVSLVDAIQEVDVGDWEGRSWVEISKTEPEAYQRFMTQSDRYGYRGGENMTQVLERVEPAIKKVCAAHLSQSIAVVAHNVVNRVLLSQVMGIPLNQARSVNQDNCGISVLRFQDGRFKLLTLNSTFHLC